MDIRIEFRKERQDRGFAGVNRRALKAFSRAVDILPLRGPREPYCLRRWQDRRQYYADMRIVRRMARSGAALAVGRRVGRPLCLTDPRPAAGGGG